MRACRHLVLTLCSTFFLLSLPSHASPTTKRSTPRGPVLAVDNDQLAVFASSTQIAGWPVALAALLRGGPTNATITWSFPEVGPAAQCTVSGVIDQPCVGPVLDIVFPAAGLYTVNLTAVDASTQHVFTSQAFSVNVAPQNILPTVTRREVRDLTTNQWDAFVQAAHVLKTFGVWDHMGRLHSAAMEDMSMERGTAHGGPSFLPWHRVFIRIVELNLQTAGNDMSIALPYWDWTFDQPNFANTPVLTNQYFGGNGTPSDNMAVTSGDFCDASVASCASANDWPVPVEFGGPTLRRDFAADTGATISTQAQMDALSTEAWYDVPPFDANSTSGFRAGMEGWILDVYGEMHNGVHRWLGGQFSQIPTSFFDPIFVAHHANIDRHWYGWQTARGCVDWTNGCYAPSDNDTRVNAGTPGAVEVDGVWRLPGHQWSDHMWPWGVAPKDVATSSVYQTWYTYAAKGTPSVDISLPIQANSGANEFVSGAASTWRLRSWRVSLYLTIAVSIAIFL